MYRTREHGHAWCETRLQGRLRGQGVGHGRMRVGKMENFVEEKTESGTGSGSEGPLQETGQETDPRCRIEMLWRMDRIKRC